MSWTCSITIDSKSHNSVTCSIYCGGTSGWSLQGVHPSASMTVNGSTQSTSGTCSFSGGGSSKIGSCSWGGLSPSTNYGVSGSWSCGYYNTSQGKNMTASASGSNSFTTDPPPFTAPSISGALSVSDNTPATGSAPGSGTTVNYSWSGSWNDGGIRQIYLDAYNGDTYIGFIRDLANPAGGSGSGSFSYKNMPSNINQIRMYAHWNGDGYDHYDLKTTAYVTMHTYKNPNIVATQTVPDTFIAGTSSLSVPLNITTYDMGDYIDSGQYFYHFTRNRVRLGQTNTDNIQLVSTTKGTGNRTTTFDTGLSDLIPNDSFQVILEKSYVNANNESAYYTPLSKTVTVVHREPSTLRSVSVQATNKTTNTVVSEMVEGYSYDLKLFWTVPADWGTRVGTRMIHLYYKTNNTRDYDVGATDTGSQNHDVEVFTPAVTGTDRPTTYYVQLYAYVDSTSNKSPTTTKYLPVKKKVAPTATGISLTSARVTTSSSPRLLMADTVDWGNTQDDSTRLVTYELFVDGEHDSYHYVSPGGSKQIITQSQYGWGNHTAYVKATYASDMGQTVYTTNTVDIEIGDYPSAPTVSVNPLSVRAGQSRTFTWSISANDWNLSLGRCFTYTIDVDGVVKENGTKAATTTSITYTQIYDRSGLVTLNIYQTNQLGNSAAVTVSGILTDPIEPTEASIYVDPIPIALPNQNPTICITREDNGTYAQSSANIKVDLYRSGTYVQNIISQRDIGMTDTAFNMGTYDLSDYVDGNSYYKVTYNKVYTTGKVVTTVYDQQIVPPDIKIFDSSYGTIPDQVMHIRFNIQNTYDSTNPYYIEYSTDYGQNWTRVDNVMSYDLQSQYLQEIWVRAYGKNPVFQKLSEIYKHEIPSQYHLKVSENGGSVQTLRRIWAQPDGTNEFRKLKRIKDKR